MLNAPTLCEKHVSPHNLKSFCSWIENFFSKIYLFSYYKFDSVVGLQLCAFVYPQTLGAYCMLSLHYRPD